MTIDERLESLGKFIEQLGERMERHSRETDERIERLGLKHEEALQKIDQRLDRLTERHEALAQSVELLKGMQQKAEKRLYRLDRLIRLIVVHQEACILRLEGEDEGGDDERGADARFRGKMVLL